MSGFPALILLLSFSLTVMAQQDEDSAGPPDVAAPAVQQEGEQQADEQPASIDDSAEPVQQVPAEAATESTRAGDEPEVSEVSEYVSPTDEVTEYLRAIDRTEIISGGYAPEMAELYQGLGQTLLERREYEKAKIAFQQGMQIVRVNQGLNSPEQTSYLFSIAEIENVVGTRRSTDEMLNLIYQLNARHYGENSVGMLPVLQRLVTWYARERPFDSEYSRYPDMLISAKLVEKMANITEKNFGLSDPKTAEYYRKSAQISWISARYALGQGISVEPGYIVSVGAPSQNPNTQGISIKQLVADGENAFRKVVESVEAQEDSTIEEQAEALAQLGDWSLAFGRRRTAAEAYKQAHELLASAVGSRDLANRYFEEPTPVRFMDPKLVPVGEDEPNDPRVLNLEVSMTVTEGGRPLNVDFLNPPENIPGDHLRKFKRDISDMRFRPRLVNGEPEDMRDFVWNFPVVQVEG